MNTNTGIIPINEEITISKNKLVKKAIPLIIKNSSGRLLSENIRLQTRNSNTNDLFQENTNSVFKQNQEYLNMIRNTMENIITKSIPGIPFFGFEYTFSPNILLEIEQSNYFEIYQKTEEISFLFGNEFQNSFHIFLKNSKEVFKYCFLCKENIKIGNKCCKNNLNFELFCIQSIDQFNYQNNKLFIKIEKEKNCNFLCKENDILIQDISKKKIIGKIKEKFSCIGVKIDILNKFNKLKFIITSNMLSHCCPKVLFFFIEKNNQEIGKFIVSDIFSIELTNKISVKEKIYLLVCGVIIYYKYFYMKLINDKSEKKNLKIPHYKKIKKRVLYNSHIGVATNM